MIKALSIGVGLASGLLAFNAQGAAFGDYAWATTEKLINEFPGRYRGQANFDLAADWMQQRMTVAGSGYQASRQDFSWVNRGVTYSSQNVVVEAAGSTGKTLIVGAHFDTATGRPTLQGLDDNASGAGVLTEIAYALAGVGLEDGVTFLGFGAEEEGLRGSKAFVSALSAEQRAALTGMINIDSLITGDKMYAHAGTDAVANPALASLREQVLAIAERLNIDLHTNPGLNSHYPEGTGCCSDGDSFLGLDIPVVYFESTNWDLGDLDGYTQTDNPAIAGGSTWHTANKDNETYLTNAFGTERVGERLSAYSQMITHLVLEATHTDQRYAALSGANALGAVQNSLMHQQKSLEQLADRHLLSLRYQSREVGSVDGGVYAQAQRSPKGGFDGALGQKAEQMDVQLYGNWQASNWLNLGAGLSFSRAQDSLEHAGKIDSDTWQINLLALLSDGGPLWATARAHVGKVDLDIDRTVNITNGAGISLLNHSLKGSTDADVAGASFKAGYELNLADWKTGPVAGLSYQHISLDGYKEPAPQRTALAFADQTLDSVQLSLGWQINGNLVLSPNLSLLPYAQVDWVEELGNGASDSFALQSLADQSVRRVANAFVDDQHFGRARIGSQLRFGEHLGVYAEANQRFKHADGSQAQFTLGVNYAF